MHRVYLDFETRARVDIMAVGGDAYCKHPQTDVMFMSWAVDDGPTRVWWPGLPFPALPADSVYVAHNAAFERAVWRYVLVPRYGVAPIADNRWACTMTACLAEGYPASLEQAALALGLPIQKMPGGRLAMLRMSKPIRWLAQQGIIQWWTREQQPILWAIVHEYCKIDTEVARLIDKQLPRLSIPMQQLWQVGNVINDRGAPIDTELCQQVLDCYERRLVPERIRLLAMTHGAIWREGQVGAILDWCENHDVPLPDVTKSTVSATLAANNIPTPVREVLEIRQKLSLTSIAKFDKMLSMAADGRARGLYMCHGAHTGRWTCRGIQLHNLFRGKLKGETDAETEAMVEQAIQLLPLGLDAVEKAFDLPGEQVLSSLIRSAIAAKPGYRLIVNDFASIENCGLAWLAGEESLLSLLRAGADLYKDMASRIFGKPAGAVTKAERQIGKIAILGLGYQMGIDKFRTTCQAQGCEGVTAELAERSVTTFRDTYSNVRRLWYGAQDAMTQAIVTRRPFACGQLVFYMRDRTCYMRLPSGRTLAYPEARVASRMKSWGDTKVIVYRGIGRNYKWAELETYGGKIVENATQGFCADVFFHAMMACEREGYPIVLHSHDELVSERPIGEGSQEEMATIMSRVPTWAPGMVIRCAGFESTRYRKD